MEEAAKLIYSLNPVMLRVHHVLSIGLNITQGTVPGYDDVHQQVLTTHFGILRGLPRDISIVPLIGVCDVPCYFCLQNPYGPRFNPKLIYLPDGSTIKTCFSNHGAPTYEEMLTDIRAIEPIRHITGKSVYDLTVGDLFTGKWHMPENSPPWI